MSCTEMALLIGASRLDVVEPGESATLEAHVASCESCRELAGLVGEAFAPLEKEPAPADSWARVAEKIDAFERASSPLVISVACTICHGGIMRQEAVYCAACLAPHHPDCFAGHGRCGAPGCGEVRVVRAHVARRPLWSVVRVAAGIVFCLLAGGGLALWTRPVEAPVEKKLPVEPPAKPVEPVAKPPTSTPIPDSDSPEKSAAERARARRVDVWRVDVLVKEAEAHANADPPRWQDAIACLASAAEVPGAPEKNAALRALMDDYRRNFEDEDRFARAVDVVQQRAVARYDESIRLLLEISPRSRVYRDAQTYLHWIYADRDVRSAKVAYDEGDWEKARALLNSSLTRAELGHDAVASVTKRLELWSTVVRAYTDGMDLWTRGEMTAAVPFLKKVLELEPNATNRYHMLAQRQLEFMQGR